MAILKKTRHEKFAQFLAEGAKPAEAYEAAGFAKHRQNAARLMTNDDISARVAELRKSISEKAEWTAADRLSTLREIAEANQINAPRVAVAAIAEANRMQGTYAATGTENRHELGHDLAKILRSMNGRSALPIGKN